MNPTDDPTDTELLAYMKQRDEKRRKNIVVAIVIAIPLVIAGFAIHTTLEGKRDADRFNDRQVCEFAGFSDC